MLYRRSQLIDLLVRGSARAICLRWWRVAIHPKTLIERRKDLSRCHDLVQRVHRCTRPERSEILCKRLPEWTALARRPLGERRRARDVGRIDDDGAARAQGEQRLFKPLEHLGVRRRRVRELMQNADACAAKRTGLE